MRFHNLHGICCRFSAVYNNGKVVPSCKLQLSHKPFLLHFMGFVIPIIVQTDFPNSHRFLIIQQSLHPRKCLFIQASDFIRMNSHCRVDIWVLPRKFHTFLTGFQRGTDIYNGIHTKLRHGRKKFVSVIVKLAVIVVCMCVKYHGFCSFPDSSFTDSIT